MILCKVVKCIETLEQKNYSYFMLFKNVAFYVKIFLRTTTKGLPPRCLPQGPHHPRSTPDSLLKHETGMIYSHATLKQHNKNSAMKLSK